MNVSSPRQLLSALPHLIGFHPSDSIVTVAMDDDEILTKETTIDGQLFLIDQNNNLYDPVSHQFIRSL
jgi:hypothetical protein